MKGNLARKDEPSGGRNPKKEKASELGPDVAVARILVGFHEYGSRSNIVK